MGLCCLNFLVHSPEGAHVDSHPVGSYDDLQDAAPVGTDVSRVGSNRTEETQHRDAGFWTELLRRRLPLRNSMTDCFAGSSKQVMSPITCGSLCSGPRPRVKGRELLAFSGGGCWCMIANHASSSWELKDQPACDFAHLYRCLLFGRSAFLKSLSRPFRPKTVGIVMGWAVWVSLCTALRVHAWTAILLVLTITFRTLLRWAQMSSELVQTPPRRPSAEMLAALDRAPSFRRRLPLRSSMTDCFAGSSKQSSVGWIVSRNWFQIHGGQFLSEPVPWVIFSIGQVNAEQHDDVHVSSTAWLWNSSSRKVFSTGFLCLETRSQQEFLLSFPLSCCMGSVFWCHFGLWQVERVKKHKLVKNFALQCHFAATCENRRHNTSETWMVFKVGPEMLRFP